MDHYGFKLPVMPINGVHYIGIKIGTYAKNDSTTDNELEIVANKLKNNEYDIESIANNGRKMGIGALFSN